MIEVEKIIQGKSGICYQLLIQQFQL